MICAGEVYNFLAPRQTSLPTHYLSKVISAKENLSRKLLCNTRSKQVHAVGIGYDDIGAFCLQIFVNGSSSISPYSFPPFYQAIPTVLIKMPQAEFLADNLKDTYGKNSQKQAMRKFHETIVGGLSGANVSIRHTHGTIGYFCRPKKKYAVGREVHLLSNSHIFANFRRNRVDECDLISQPSPTEIDNHRPIAKLKRFSEIQFENNYDNPNYIDAAIAKLFKQIPYKPEIPLIGKIGSVSGTKSIKPGMLCKKVGRTTGYTEGKIVSINLDIWVNYSRGAKKALFKDQILIQPIGRFNKFVSNGDSGSMVVNHKNSAVGLIFAGTDSDAIIDNWREIKLDKIKHLDNCGVANPIEMVLDRLNIELVN